MAKKISIIKQRARNYGVTEELIQQIAFKLKKDQQVTIICRLESKQRISDRLRELGVDFRVLVPDDTKRSVSTGTLHSWHYEKFKRGEPLKTTEHGQYDANLFPGFWDDPEGRFTIPKRE